MLVLHLSSWLNGFLGYVKGEKEGRKKAQEVLKVKRCLAAAESGQVCNLVKAQKANVHVP